MIDVSQQLLAIYSYEPENLDEANEILKTFQIFK